MTGADIIVQTLADEGVDTLFGYSGGAILPTYDAIFRYNAERQARGEKEMTLIVPANEQGAGFMAAGYARASGKVGVFVVTSGPGATNSVTPIRDCMADSVPVVLICGQVPRAALGTDAFQEAPVFNIMSACAKHTFLVTEPEELEPTIRSAFEIARSGRPGPVVVDIPKDIQNWSGAYRGHGGLHMRGLESHRRQLDESRLSARDCELFFDLLCRSQRPLIYAGGGVVNANAAYDLREFAERFGIPVVTTLMALGAVDNAEPLSLHMLGMHGTAYANYAVQDCDFLIAVGARFDDRVAGQPKRFAPNARAIAHIDIDAAEVGKVKAVHWSHSGDAKRALRSLIAAGANISRDFSSWRTHIQGLKQTHSLNYDRTNPAIQPQAVMECLNELTQGEAIVATGVGQHQMWAAQYLRFKHPRFWLTSGSMGTMGFGLPAAVGAQVAFPDRIVVDIDGDGSIRMNLGEMETLTTYNLPVKVLLMNNVGDGMVRQWQNLYFGQRFCATDKTLHKKDFIKSAEADGFGFACRVSHKADLFSSMKAFLAHNGPALLEVQIDMQAEVYPMIGPGAGYDEMMTGKFIAPRNGPTPIHSDTEKPDLF